MRPTILIVGAAILVISIFGYAYADDQQSLGERAEDAIEGERADWEMISSVSLAGIALGVVLVAVGLVPEDWYGSYSTNNRTSV